MLLLRKEIVDFYHLLAFRSGVPACNVELLPETRFETDEHYSLGVVIMSVICVVTRSVRFSCRFCSMPKI